MTVGDLGHVDDLIWSTMVDPSQSSSTHLASKSDSDGLVSETYTQDGHGVLSEKL